MRNKMIMFVFMRRILVVLLLSLLTVAAFGQEADTILGDYFSVQKTDEFKVRISKNANGTYKGQVFWVKDAIDAKTGRKWTDSRNPDKSLRNVPCDRIVLFNGLKYNPEKSRWDGTKIYDPQRGLRANVTVVREKDGTLRLKGTLMGISETVFWTRIQ